MFDYIKKAQWRTAIRDRAEYIRGLVKGSKVFGQDFKMNDADAVHVAIYMKGVEEGRENFIKVLAAMPDPHKAVDEIVKSARKDKQ